MASSKDSGKKTSAPVPDPSKWVVVQLTPLGEREKNIALIRRSVKSILGIELDVFVPAISQKDVENGALTTWFSEGYVFVKYVPTVSYHKLSETNYFNTVLSSMSNVNGERKRIYSLLDDKELAPMRVGMQDLKTEREFEVEQDVKIVKGTYKGLPAKISMVYEDREKVQVYVHLRSKKMFIDFPSSYIQKVET